MLLGLPCLMFKIYRLQRAACLGRQSLSGMQPADLDKLKPWTSVVATETSVVATEKFCTEACSKASAGLENFPCQVKTLCICLNHMQTYCVRRDLDKMALL